MKHTRFFYLLIFSALIISCDEVLNDLGFTIKTDYYEFEFEIFPSNTGEFVYNDMAFPRNVDSILKAKGHSVSMLESIQFEEVHFSIDDTSSITNFDNIKDLVVVIKTAGITDTVAWIYNIPNQIDSVTLSVSNKEVMNYLYDDAAAIEIEGFIESKLLDTIKVKGSVSYLLGLKH